MKISLCYVSDNVFHENAEPEPLCPSCQRTYRENGLIVEPVHKGRTVSVGTECNGCGAIQE